MAGINKTSLIFVSVLLFVALFAVSVSAAVNLEAPANLSWTSSTNNSLPFTFNISATGGLEEGQVGCNLTLNSVVVAQNTTMANDTTTTLYSNASFAAGLNTWYVSCWNASGVNVSAARSFYFDNVAPTVTLISPINNTNTSTLNPSLTFNVSDGLGSPYNCSLYIDGVYNQSNASTANATTTVFTMPALSEGRHGWNVTCFDNASNQDDDRYYFTVDYSVPLPFMLESNHSWFNTASPSIDFMINDTYSAVLLYRFFVDDAANTGGSVNNATPDAAVLSGLVNGTHTLKLQGNDSAANKANSSAWTIYVDTAAPVVTPISPVDKFNTSSSPVTVQFNMTDNLGGPTYSCVLYVNGTVNQTNATTLNATTTTFLLGASPGAYSWYVNCTDNATNVGTSTVRTLTIDAVGPTINSIYLGEADNFVSGNAANNKITLTVNATDAGTDVYYITANFTEITYANVTLANMTYSAGLWTIVANVSNTTEYEFMSKNVSVVAYDYAGNPNTAGAGDYYRVVLYNMTTMRPSPNGCSVMGSGSTDFSTETNWNNINLTLLIDLNFSSACGLPAMAVDNTFHRVAKFNFTSMNMTSQSAFNQLGQFMSSIDVQLTPDGTFGNSRIYLNSSAVSSFNTSVVLTLYGLPFDSLPAIIGDVGTANNGTSIIYSPYTTVQGVFGNLTFTVSGFSGYNVSDTANPLITVNAPTPNATKVQGPTPTINVTVNGTGTQVSNLTMIIDGTTHYMTEMTCYNATGSESMTCYFNPTVSDGTHAVNITAWDYGSSSPGNSNSTIWNYTSDSAAPAVSGNSTNRTVIGGSIPVQINVTAVDATTNVSNVTVGATGYAVQMTHIGSNVYQANTTATALGCIVDGTCTLIFNATDYWNQSNSTLTMGITVDGGAPAVSGGSVTNATKAKNATQVSIQVIVVDSSTVSNVTVNNNQMYLLSGTTYYANRTGAQLGCGASGSTCTLTFNATDVYGNSNVTVTTSYTIDETAPINTSAFSASTTSSSATISATFGEAVECTVNYGTNESALGTSVSSSSFATTGAVALSGLSASTLYYYNVTSCWDEAYNYNNTVLGPFNFTTDAASSGGGSGGGGSGGGGVSLTDVGDITGTDTQWSLGVGDKVMFEYNGFEHTIRVTKVGAGYATFQVASEVQEFTLYTGQSKEVDLTEDGKPDVTVKMLDMLYNKAVVKVASLATGTDRIALLPPAKVVREQAEEQPVAAPEAAAPAEQPSAAPAPAPAAAPQAPVVEQKKDASAWLVPLVLVIIVAAVIAAIVFARRKRSRT